MTDYLKRIEIAVISIVSIGFVVWGAAFIYRSSFIAIDGKRYFSLFDDAMISMRYAWNFAHGFGLVWNQGVFVQGYTNLLMTLLMSGATLFFDKSHAVLFIQITGIFFMLLIAYVSMRITTYTHPKEYLERQKLIRILTFICALSYYPLVYWSLMGMETGLLTILLLASILFSLEYTKELNQNRLYLVSVCLGLAYLTRNDSFVYAFLIYLYITWKFYSFESKFNLKHIKQIAKPIGIYSIFIFGQSAFQFLYYGEWLPNTYTLKLTGMHLILRISNGIGYITPFLAGIAFVFIIACIGFIFNFRSQKLLLLSIFASAIGYQIYVGGDPWAYWRIMSPVMPLLIILFIVALSDIELTIVKNMTIQFTFFNKHILQMKYLSQILIIMLTISGMYVVNQKFIKEITFVTKPYQSPDNEKNVNTALAINQLTISGASIGVFWAGSIPYYSDNRLAIDFLGKSDKYIANLPPDISGAIGWNGMSSVPGHNKYDLNYSIKMLKPTYVERFIWGLQDLSEWKKTRYVNVNYRGINLFLLKDSPLVLWDKVNSP